MAVVVPTYNRQRFVTLAIDSALSQNYPGVLEIIVVDDGSTDATAEVVRPYLEQEHARRRVRYERLEHQGVVAARNHALRISTSDWVAFLDSDDLWLPEKLSQQIRLAERAGAGLVHTSFRYIDPESRIVDDGPQRIRNPAQGHCVKALLQEDTVIFSSVIIRRSIIDQIASESSHGLPFDPRWTNSQDYDLLLRTARICEFGYITEALTHYRMHDAQTGMGNLRRVFEYHCRVQIDFVARYGEEQGLDPEAGRDAARSFLLDRAESHYWQRDLSTARSLCELARHLGLTNESFDRLERRLAHPGFVFRIKDTLDRMIEGVRGKHPLE